ncbi:MAG: carboxypeptidase regulatory-like domain-containing protein [Flavobacteriaceae bacterium]
MGFSFCSFSQVAITISGKVLDTLQNPLQNTNIIAIPDSNNLQIVYTTTKTDGSFKIELINKGVYELTFSHLGYLTKKSTITAIKGPNINIVLRERIEQLNEIIIDYTPPIQIKKDTISYTTDAFVSGKERKLREVLKKLPGIEVDHEGNVTSQGKSVTKVLVEDKIFFTGNSKLAVNNIPADAVDKIQVIEDYNEVGFLKGLQNSEDVALNIKLKENKKKFAFGDIETGGGDEERYLAHSNLFYYSPKTNVNFIADLNNIDIKSFTLKDYIDFNGGFGKLIGDIKGYLTLSNDDFSQFLINDDFKANINRFGALNIRQTLSPSAEVNSYFILNNSDTENETRTLNIYNSDENQFNENRVTTNTLNNFFVLGKITLNYKPNIKEHLSSNTFIKITNNSNNGSILTESTIQDNTFAVLSDLDALDFKQNLEYSKRFSKAQTLSLETTLNYQESTPTTNWITNETFLAGLIPLEDDTVFETRQQRETRTTAFDILVRDYWVLNNFNHVYTTMGADLLFQNYTSQETQILGNGILNEFSDNGFGNNMAFRLGDVFMGLEYKFLTGIFTIKSSLFYHCYQWENTQQNIRIKDNTNAILPEFNSTAEFNSSEKLRFRYRRQIRFPEGNRFLNNFLLNSFNSILLGNPNLSNERFHTYSLNYYKFNLFRGLNLNTGINYNRKTQSAKNTTDLDGIDQFVTYNMFSRPENSITGNFNFSKTIGDVKLSVQSSANYSEFFQLVNDDISKNTLKTFSLTGKVETSFKDWPNFELGYTYEPSTFSTRLFVNEFTNTELFVNLSYYFFKDFQFNGDFKRTNYDNISQKITNTFDIVNVSFFYQKEDSPWGFEVSSTNLLGTQYKRQNSFTNFLISDQTTFIIPRIVLFKISYKL